MNPAMIPIMGPMQTNWRNSAMISAQPLSTPTAMDYF